MQKIPHLEKENAAHNDVKEGSLFSFLSISCNNLISNKAQPLLKAYSSFTESSRPPTVLPTYIPYLSHTANCYYLMLIKGTSFSCGWWVPGEQGLYFLQSAQNFANRKHLLNSIFSKSKSLCFLAIKCLGVFYSLCCHSPHYNNSRAAEFLVP